VYIETGARRVFACAVDWPGWCRSAKDEDLALDALRSYAQRYWPVAKEAGIVFPKGAADALEVVERVAGGSTTDFGAPESVARADGEPLSLEQVARQGALVAAAWTVFDRIVAGSPAHLRKGPRGGGRDRDAIVAHVLGAEVVYARKLGIRRREPDPDDAKAIHALRDGITGVLSSVREPAPLVERGWPVRYAARRIAWHVLDHAWEIEDRREPQQAQE